MGLMRFDQRVARRNIDPGALVIQAVLIFVRSMEVLLLKCPMLVLYKTTS